MPQSQSFKRFPVQLKVINLYIRSANFLGVSSTQKQLHVGFCGVGLGKFIDIVTGGRRPVPQASIPLGSFVATGEEPA
jgi:hypothetical protein